MVDDIIPAIGQATVVTKVHLDSIQRGDVNHPLTAMGLALVISNGQGHPVLTDTGVFDIGLSAGGGFTIAKVPGILGNLAGTSQTIRRIQSHTQWGHTLGHGCTEDTNQGVRRLMLISTDIHGT